MHAMSFYANDNAMFTDKPSASICPSAFCKLEHANAHKQTDGILIHNSFRIFQNKSRFFNEIKGPKPQNVVEENIPT